MDFSGKYEYYAVKSRYELMGGLTYNLKTYTRSDDNFAGGTSSLTVHTSDTLPSTYTYTASETNNTYHSTNYSRDKKENLSGAVHVHNGIATAVSV